MKYASVSAPRLSQFFAMAVVLGLVSSAAAQAFNYSVLYSDKNNLTDPRFPEASLITDSAGNLYGTSFSGGSDHSQCNEGCGTVFKVTQTGVMSVLHYFQQPPDGINPQTSLVRDSAGNLYGSTNAGGTDGGGTVFKIRLSGVETILHNFSNQGDGSSPSSLVLDAAGNIYGTAQTSDLAGLVFKIDANNNFSVLYNFCSLSDCADGQLPVGGVLIDNAGNLYGTTADGGAYGEGTLFKVTPEGLETVLHSFGGVSGDGANPYGNLKQDAFGNLYGVTNVGGANDPLDIGPGGTLYKVPKIGGSDTVLYSFCSLSECKDGFSPIGPVQIDESGNFYGVTLSSNLGSNESATVWEVNRAGKETVRYTFGSNIFVPAGLLIDASGNLYGTIFDGEQNDKLGAVYKLTKTNLQ